MVRVCTLLVPERPVDGTSTVLRQPRVGDIGTVVHVYDSSNMIVECCDEGGFTLWVADFSVDELERGDSVRP